MPKSELNLSGGLYAPVADRIALFYERYPEGRIISDLRSRDGGEVVFRARVYRTTADRWPAATGWASERMTDGAVNAVACVENTETSAIGRALANLGFLASAHRPSREEMEKVSRHESRGGSRPEDARQRRANLAGDAIELIDAAVAAGLDEERAAALRKTLHRSGCTTRDIDRVGSWVRRWLDEPRGQSAPSE